MSSVTRTYSLRPYTCCDKKTGKGIDLHTILDEVRDDATLCATEAFKHVTIDNLKKLTEHDGVKPAIAGRRMGIRFSVPGRGTGRSRFEWMIREYAVTQLRSWMERCKANTGQTNKYVSTGYTPERFLEPGARVIAPTIHIDNRDRVMFNWYVKIPVERTEFSSRYVIGVDVGLTNHITAVVRDVTTGRVVEASFMNRRIRSLENKIQRVKTQIASLYRKGQASEV